MTHPLSAPAHRPPPPTHTFLPVPNLMSCGSREMSISYGIEAQLNKKASKITPRRPSFFFFGYKEARPTKAKYMQQQHAISLLYAAVVSNL